MEISPSREPTFHEYLGSCKDSFCILVVCKRDLCLLTWTGRSIDWTDYWRKMGVLLKETRSIDGNWMVCWRKLDGLLTETGRIIDGKWVFCWRKQDGLLTETGWCVDGNWMVNWLKLVGLFMEAVSPADFLRFRGLKMRFCRLPKPALSSSTSILQLIFSTLEARKYYFFRVVKPWVQNYQASHFTHFGFMKMISDDFWNQHFKVPRNEWKLS